MEGTRSSRLPLLKEESRQPRTKTPGGGRLIVRPPERIKVCCTAAELYTIGVGSVASTDASQHDLSS